MHTKVVVITGPTATGKTRLGVLLAKRFGGEIVGADSMQIYKHMDIGTAKPTPEETEGTVHHMIDIVSPFENYSVSRYVEDASRCVDEILSQNKLPIIVGGTGLYIESLLSGRCFAPDTENTGLRSRLIEKYDEVGGGKMRALLSEFDPESAAKLHANDKKRIVRAFEVYEMTGKTISDHNFETKSIPARYDSIKIALDFEDRSDLYNRINRRVDDMAVAGLENEVSSLLDMGLNEKYTAMQAIGYKEMADAINGKYSVETALEKIKMESRKYAKRQLSWLRRDNAINWIIWEKEPDFEKGLRISTGFLK